MQREEDDKNFSLSYHGEEGNYNALASTPATQPPPHGSSLVELIHKAEL